MKKKPIKLVEFVSDRQAEKANFEKSLVHLNNGMAKAIELLKKYRPDEYSDLLLKQTADKINENPVKFLTMELTAKAKVEGMILSPAKILELQNIDLTPLSEMFAKGKKALTVSNYRDGQYHISKTKMENALKAFTTFTKSDRETEIAEACNDIIKAFDHLQEITGTALNYRGLSLATNNAINTYRGERCLHPEGIRQMARMTKSLRK